MRAVDLTRSAFDGVERVLVVLDQHTADYIARVLLAHEGEDSGVRETAYQLAPSLAPTARPARPLHRRTYDCAQCEFHIVDDSEDAEGFHEAVDEHEEYHRETREAAEADG